MKVIALLLTMLLTGCATLEPDSIRLDVAHESHLLQHFDGSGGHNGAELVGADAHWQRGRWYLDVGEYYSPGAQVDNRHEVFEAHGGYELWVRP